MSVCLISSFCLLTFSTGSLPPLPPIELLVSKGKALIVFREKSSPLNVGVMMLASALRLHSNAGNYALPFSIPSAVPVESIFSRLPVLNRCPRLLGCCSTSASPKNYTSAWVKLFLFHATLRKGTWWMAGAGVLLWLGSGDSLLLVWGHLSSLPGTKYTNVL